MELRQSESNRVAFGGRDWRLGALVLCALLLRLAFFVAVQPWDPEVERSVILVADAAGYHNRAVGILAAGGFETFGAFRTPLYPLFIAGVYAVAGVKPYIVLLLQTLVGSATVLLVHSWAHRAVGPRAALIAAAVFAFQPLQILATGTLLTETLFIIGFLASVVVLVMGLERRRLSLLVLSGLLLGLSTLVRPATQYFPIVAVCIVLIYRGVRPSFKAKAAAVLVFAFVLSIAPWLYRNHTTYGATSLSCHQGESLIFFGMTHVEMAKTGKSIEQVRGEFRAIAAERGVTEDANPFENERVYREIVASRMKADPLFYARMHMLSIVKMFTNLSTSSISTQLRLPAGGLPYDYYSSPTIAGMVGGFLRTKSIHEVVAAGVVAIVLALTYLSALVGVVSSLRERKYFYLATTLLIILYFAAAIGPMGQARYRLPLACYYIAWSGLGCLEIHGWIQRRWRLRSERRLASADGRCAKR